MNKEIKLLQDRVEGLSFAVESLDKMVSLNENDVEDFIITTNNRLNLLERRTRNLEDDVDDINDTIKKSNDVIDNGTVSAEDVQIKNMVIDNEKISFFLTGTDPVKPEHYRKGEIDLFESWYLKHSFDEYRAIMQSHAEKYIYRNKNNRVEDLEKAIYVLQRLKEKEELNKD